MRCRTIRGKALDPSVGLTEPRRKCPWEFSRWNMTAPRCATCHAQPQNQAQHVSISAAAAAVPGVRVSGTPLWFPRGDRGPKTALCICRCRMLNRVNPTWSWSLSSGQLWLHKRWAAAWNPLPTFCAFLLISSIFVLSGGFLSALQWRAPPELLSPCTSFQGVLPVRRTNQSSCSVFQRCVCSWRTGAVELAEVAASPGASEGE